MWLLILAIGFSAVLLAGTLSSLWPDIRAASRPWKLLGCSGLSLSLAGLGFVVRFWNPSPGPYLANARYPFGSYVDAWAVSFGFMWLAFGALFFLAACVAPRTGRLWFGLFAAWCLAWLPHVVIGVAAATAGSNAPSVALYKRWGSTTAGSLVLISSAMVLLAHFSLSLVGFGLTARELRQSADPGAGGSG